jgi:hypothetical protein
MDLQASRHPKAPVGPVKDNREQKNVTVRVRRHGNTGKLGHRICSVALRNTAALYSRRIIQPYIFQKNVFSGIHMILRHTHSTSMFIVKVAGAKLS